MEGVDDVVSVRVTTEGRHCHIAVDFLSSHDQRPIYVTLCLGQTYMSASIYNLVSDLIVILVRFIWHQYEHQSRYRKWVVKSWAHY